jgi:hypothetical protein
MNRAALVSAVCDGAGFARIDRAAAAGAAA